jgi:hypothetical protein
MLYIQLNVPYHSYTFECTEYLLHLIIRENATIYVNILQERSPLLEQLNMYGFI